MTPDPSPELLRVRERVVAFYAYETALLDDGRLGEWLALFDDDARYVMPMLETREGEVPDCERALPSFYVFDEDKESLRARVVRLETGLALVESPPSVTQRLVTDVLLTDAAEDRVAARSSFLVYQLRDEQNGAFFIGRREDRLRPHGTGFRIVRRDIVLAQYVLPRAISVFF